MAPTAQGAVQAILLAIAVTVGIIVTVLAGVYTGALTGKYLMIVLVIYIVGDSAHRVYTTFSSAGFSATGVPSDPLTSLGVAKHVLLGIIATVGVIVTVLAAIYQGALVGDYLMVVLVSYVIGNAAHLIAVSITPSGFTTGPVPKPVS